MKRFITITLFFAFVLLSTQAQKSFSLKTGDLLFQVGGDSDFNDAIKAVTDGAENLPFSHVGVVYVEDGNFYVLEAESAGVVKTKLDDFLNDSQKYNGKPMVVVARMKRKYRDAIPPAIEKIQSLMGRPYDSFFTPNDDKYYCSELVYECFTKNGKAIFESKAMTFKDNSGNFSPLWIEHFEKHNQPIPEGEQGTNPGDMSKSDKLRFVYRYF